MKTEKEKPLGISIATIPTMTAKKMNQLLEHRHYAESNVEVVEDCNMRTIARNEQRSEHRHPTEEPAEVVEGLDIVPN